MPNRTEVLKNEEPCDEYDYLIELMQEEKNNNRMGTFAFSQKERKIMLDNLQGIQHEINRLQELEQPKVDPKFKVTLSRTKTFQITKENNSVMCEFLRPCVLPNRKDNVSIQLSLNQWNNAVMALKNPYIYIVKNVCKKRPADENSEDERDSKKSSLEKNSGPHYSEEKKKYLRDEDNGLQCLVAVKAQKEEDKYNDHETPNKVVHNTNNKPSTFRLCVYQWEWVNPTSQKVVEQARRWWIDPLRCAVNAMQNKPENMLVEFQVKAKHVNFKELVKSIHVFLVEKELALLQQMDCYGCDHDSPGQKDHMEGCLLERESACERYLETANSKVGNTKTLKMFLALKKELNKTNQIDENDFIYIMNYHLSLDDLKATILANAECLLDHSLNELPPINS